MAFVIASQLRGPASQGSGQVVYQAKPNVPFGRQQKLFKKNEVGKK